MFKLVVLFAFVAIAAAKPSHPWAYDLPTASGYAYSSSIHAPDYVNHQSVSAPLISAPAVISAPLVSTYSVPAAVSHQSQTQIHSKPALIAAPLYAPAIHSYHAAPIVHGW